LETWGFVSGRNIDRDAVDAGGRRQAAFASKGWRQIFFLKASLFAAGRQSSRWLLPSQIFSHQRGFAPNRRPLDCPLIHR